MFNIWFLDENNEKKQVWQTSWGLSTRSIGAMIMVHSDDQGLVLPPKVAMTQVIIIPIEKVNEADKNKDIMKKCNDLHATLKAAGIRVDVDDRDNQKAAWKYNYWE